MVSTPSLTFAALSALNSYTDSESLTLTTSTNGYSGYAVSMYGETLPTAAPKTIAAYSGSWATPTSWSGTGIGYTSSDTNVSGSNRFAGASKYAGVPVGPSNAQLVADHTPAVEGNVTGTPIVNESVALTFKVAVPATQPAGRYGSTVDFVAVATY
jgi:hypothetical protein